jgi:DNA polymerase III sliding clamp (beta) subunit (PCNA family)
MGQAATLATTATTAVQNHTPSGVEQEHIKEALEASQTAMDAIATVTSLTSYTLTILGIFIALLALWGVSAVVRTAKATAKQIANERFKAYIETDEFKELVKERIAKSVDEKWGNTFVIRRLAEDEKDPADFSPFPSAPDKGAIK